MTSLTIGIAQLYPKLGDIAYNLDKHLEMMENAAQQGGQLVVFPELSLTGYYLRDLVAELASKPTSDDPVFGPLLKKTKALQLDAVVGFVEEDGRGRFYISAAYLSRGEVLHVHRKIYLPDYTMFEDRKFFAAGSSIRAFDTFYGRVGVLICEDFWHVSPPYILWMDGADMLLLMNASPGRGISKDEKLATSRWIEMVSQAYAGMFTNYIVMCNRVGFEDGVNFGGGSTLISPDGIELVHGPYFEEKLLMHTIDLNDLRRVRARLPLLRDERPDLMMHEMNRIISQNGLNGR